MEEFFNYVKKYDGSLRDLAQDIGAMSYDAVRDLLKYLKEDLERQKEIDRSLNRHQLVEKEEQFLRHLSNSIEKMDEIWKICEPYSIVHSREKPKN